MYPPGLGISTRRQLGSDNVAVPLVGSSSPVRLQRQLRSWNAVPARQRESTDQTPGWGLAIPRGQLPSSEPGFPGTLVDGPFVGSKNTLCSVIYTNMKICWYKLKDVC